MEGLRKTIEDKQAKEKERPLLRTDSGIITIDGSDGSGKTTLARKVCEELIKRFGTDRLLLLNTNLKRMSGQDRLRQAEKREEESGRRAGLVKAWIAGANRAYEEAEKALAEGKVVIIDKSELAMLNFALELGDRELMATTHSLIENGTATRRLWAGNRVVLSSQPEDIEANLATRGGRSIYDPQDLEGVRQRLASIETATREILNMPHEGDINVIRKENHRIVDPQKAEEYLDALATEITDQLVLDRTG